MVFLRIHEMTKDSGSKNVVNIKRIEEAVRDILIAVGEDPDREGLLETPNRVARMYAELFSGLKEDPKQYVSSILELYSLEKSV